MSSQFSFAAALSELDEQEALSAAAQRVARVGTFIAEADTGVSTWSKELRRIFGIPGAAPHLPIRTILDLTHPEDREVIAAAVQGSMEIGGSYDIEHRIVTLDGHLRHVHVQAEVVELPGRLRPAVVGTAQDVTERKRTEETIRAQADQLKEAEANLIFVARQNAVGAMASALAHEVTQPLTAITNYASAISRFAASDPKVVEGVVNIQNNALRAGASIQQIGDMVRGRRTRRENLPMDDVVREGAHFAAMGACAGVAVEFSFTTGGRAWGDRVQIQQVLVNLVRNACEAVDDSADKRITLRTSDVGDYIKVAVSDTGPGIEEDDIERLFHARSSIKGDGMGIGLSISRTIIEGHGGQIGAYNLPAGGACFWFTLPKTDPAIDRPQQKS